MNSRRHSMRARHRRAPKMIDEEKHDELDELTEAIPSVTVRTDIGDGKAGVTPDGPRLPDLPDPISALPSKEAGSGSGSGSSLSNTFSALWSKLSRKLGVGPSCQNGGNQKVSGICECLPYYTGDLCETKTCLYGGHLLASGKCACDDPHYRGQHCEQIVCENSGQPNASSGACLCVGDWYHGKFCEHYSKPWKVIFGAGGGGLILLVVLCVLCRLIMYNSSTTSPTGRRRRNQQRHNLTPNNDHQPTARSNRWQQQHGGGNRAHQSGVQQQQPQLGSSHHHGQPQRVRLPPHSNAEQPNSPSLQLQPLIAKPPSPPPAYDDVITDAHRFPCASPTTVGVAATISQSATTPGTPPPSFTESQQQHERDQVQRQRRDRRTGDRGGGRGEQQQQQASSPRHNRHTTRDDR